jgi:hypothetical protein
VKTEIFLNKMRDLLRAGGVYLKIFQTQFCHLIVTAKVCFGLCSNPVLTNLK